MRRIVLLSSLFLLSSVVIYSQNIGIGSTAITPDASAGLEVQFNNKGVLIPRVALTGTTDGTTIASPANSLLVYCTGTGGLSPEGYYYNSNTPAAPNWVRLATGSSTGDAWLLLGNAGTVDGINFLGTTDNVAVNFRVNNAEAGRIGTTADGSVFLGYESGLYDDHSNNHNTFIGFQSGRANTTGYSNTVSGYQALYSNTTGYENTALGAGVLYYNTTGSYNTASGYGALYNNTTGNNNIAFGNAALYSNQANRRSTAIGYQSMYFADNRTTGRETYNTAVGFQALRGSTTAANNTGQYNTAIGDQALRSNTTGGLNTANGYQALYSNTTGAGNTAHGYMTLYSNTTGYSNNALGVSALYDNTTGYRNTASGSSALTNNTTGHSNTAHGYFALVHNTVGSYNTALGSYAGSAFYSNTTSIGYNAIPSSDNTVRIGNSSVTSIGGYEPWTNVSDGRFKTNVQENVPGLVFINKLRPVTYQLDMNAIADFNKTPDSLRLYDSEKIKAQEMQIGFIAQEVEQAAQSLGFDFHGVDKPKNAESHYGLRYAEFTVPLVKAVQELSLENEELRANDEQLKMENEQLKLMIQNLEKRLELLEEQN